MTHVVRRVALLLVPLLVTGSLAALPAGSAPSWTSPSVPLSPVAAKGGSPEIAVNDSGVAVAIWQSRYDGFSRAVIESSVHPVGGSWSAPSPLSASGGFGAQPDVAVDAAGNAVAVWQQDADTSTPFIEAATRVGGVWSAPVPISSTSHGAYVPKVAVDDAGNAVAIWNSDNSVQWSSKPAGGAWSAPLRFDGTISQDQIDNALTMTAGGVASAAWTDIEPGHEVVVVTSRPVGGSWSTPAYASSMSEDAQSVDIASSASGKALLIWTLVGANPSTPDPDDLQYVVQARVRPDATSGWGSVTDLSLPGVDAGSSRAAMDDLGRGSVVWYRTDAGHRTVETARFTAENAWTGRVDLSAVGVDATSPDIAIAGMGDAVAVWRDAGTGALQSARRPIGLTGWGPPQNLTDGALDVADPRAAADAAGNAVAVWGDVDPGGSGAMRVLARAFDAVGPIVGQVSVPTKGQAEKATTMSVDATDAWSPFTVVWTFGDGKQATGTTVRHRYANKGLYKVTMTATDAVGNLTTKGATIFVGPPLPRMSVVRLTRTAIHMVGSSQRPRATRLKFRLNTRALVVVKLKRTLKLHGKVVRGEVSKRLDAGKRSIRLTSRAGTKNLPPGTYKVTVTAKNQVGTSRAKTVRLTIRR